MLPDKPASKSLSIQSVIVAVACGVGLNLLRRYEPQLDPDFASIARDGMQLGLIGALGAFGIGIRRAVGNSGPSGGK